MRDFFPFGDDAAEVRFDLRPLNGLDVLRIDFTLMVLGEFVFFIFVNGRCG